MEPKNVSSNIDNEFLILQSWRDSSALIKFNFDCRAQSTRLWVRVKSVDTDKEEAVLTVTGESSGSVTLRLAGATMLYRDSVEPDSETDPALKAAFAEVAVCGIEIVLPTGEVIVLWELRESD
jgi:hypothetical protein